MLVKEGLSQLKIHLKHNSKLDFSVIKSVSYLLIIWHRLASKHLQTVSSYTNLIHTEPEPGGVNSSFPGQNDRHLANDLFRCIFVNETFCVLIKISVKFVPKGPIDNKAAFGGGWVNIRNLPAALQPLVQGQLSQAQFVPHTHFPPPEMKWNKSLLRKWLPADENFRTSFLKNNLIQVSM